MEKKKINWSNVLWVTLKIIFLVIINGATISWFILNFYGDGDIKTPLGVIHYSFWNTLETKYKVVVYMLMLLGAFSSYVFLKYLYKSNKQDKKDKKQYDLEERKIKAQEDTNKKLNDLIDKTLRK